MISVRGLWRRLRHTVVGPPRDPFDPTVRERIALVAFFAWIGLGADGLSSANYGPELGFLALKGHSHLALYLALLTAVTVFVIALGYNQVIRLFPTGGGGYRVSTALLGRYAGLVTGVCLIVDYVLTIAISIASGVDALFSLLPLDWQGYKTLAGVLLILVLIVLNLRGVKESVAVLMPIFVGFLISHVVLIVYGVAVHAGALPEIARASVEETRSLSQHSGALSVLFALLLAYSLGGGTYTGLEAVSNNIQTLAEPRVRTGRVTMMYMAVSLAFVAAGIILLYLLWDVRPVQGQTLNAVVFRLIAGNWTIGGQPIGGGIVTAVLVFEAGLLFVAANTGFLGGPAVLANMALDEWAPHMARSLSSRLVTQNGVMVMGLAAMLVLWLSQGAVDLMVVMYSMTVFGAFSLTLLGMVVYWVRMRGREAQWLGHLMLSGIGFLICAGILAMIIVSRFADGGWVTLLIVGLLVWLFYGVNRHYRDTRVRLDRADRLFARKVAEPAAPPPPLDPQAPTAIFLVGGSIGAGMHSLLWVRRLFGGQFRNFLFVRVGEVDTHSFGGEERLERLSHEVDGTLGYFIAYCRSHGLAASGFKDFGTDTVRVLTKLVEEIVATYPNAMVFASKLIFEDDGWWTRLLHNQTAEVMQRQLHMRGIQMVILPMVVQTPKQEPPSGAAKRRSFHWRATKEPEAAPGEAAPSRLGRFG
jgi:amino acid transporter